MTRDQTLAVFGFIVLVPAIILVTGGLLGLDVPGGAVHPALVIGGMVAALALNAAAVVRIRFAPDDGVIVGTLRVRGASLNLSALIFSGLLLAVILTYAFLENFQARPIG